MTDDDDRSRANRPGQGDSPPDGRDDGWFSRHQRAAWIAAGATLAAALITVLVPILASSDEDGGAAAPSDGPTSSAPESDSAPEPEQSADSSRSPDSSTGSSSANGTELWKGSLLLDHSPKDLDAGQPVAVGYADTGDLYMTFANQIIGGHGSVVSLWAGPADTLPDFQQCADTVTAAGAGEQELVKDVVLCVQTSEGNIARLKLIERGSSGAGRDHRNFDAVIWQGS
ncbi:hypothetical protein MTQ01_01525 [Streptomyces sp. XM4193]|uniref:hypothetical protein n=1 Tax=Streptomyces sp. XM4193 TaxID=2929782 RepID=UPI001FF7A168|nr:hypothetical protein [Streptomyces sp. XM4193]MCK1794726.1 hypothetical protein [Streptomyces sp. XM4193]